MLAQQRRRLEARLRRPVLHNHRRATAPCRARLRLVCCRQPDVAHAARLPAHARAQQQRLVPRRQLQHLAKFHAQRLSHALRRAGHQRVQRHARQRPLPKLRQLRLLPRARRRLQPQPALHAPLLRLAQRPLDGGPQPDEVRLAHVVRPPAAQRGPRRVLVHLAGNKYERHSAVGLLEQRQRVHAAEIGQHEIAEYDRPAALLESLLKRRLRPHPLSRQRVVATLKLGDDARRVAFFTLDHQHAQRDSHLAPFPHETGCWAAAVDAEAGHGAEFSEWPVESQFTFHWSTCFNAKDAENANGPGGGAFLSVSAQSPRPLRLRVEWNPSRWGPHSFA